jgi:hypothetical protein
MLCLVPHTLSSLPMLFSLATGCDSLQPHAISRKSRLLEPRGARKKANSVGVDTQRFYVRRKAEMVYLDWVG